MKKKQEQFVDVKSGINEVEIKKPPWVTREARNIDTI